MGAVLQKKMATPSTTYAPAVWPETVNLLGKLPERTASGSIAAITDGADMVPLKSWEIEVSPNLSGKSSVVCTQTGQNLFEYGERAEMVRNGITSSVSADGTITASGTSTGNGDIPITLSTSVVLQNGQSYTFSLDGTDTRSGSIYVYFAGGGYISIPNSRSYGTYTPTSDVTITGVTLRMFNGQSITLSAKMQIEVGSTAHAYEPYTAPVVNTVSLGRTVYGGNVDVVNGTGTESHAKITDFSTLRANGISSTGAYRYIIDVSGMGDYNVGACVATEDLLTYRVSYNANVGEFYNTTNVLIIFLAQDNAQDAITYLQSNSCEIAYPLATPIDFSFDPITPTPETVEVCNFWADEGDSTVVYRADIDALLSSLSGNRGLMLSSPQPETLSKAETEETEGKKEKEDSPEVLEK